MASLRTRLFAYQVGGAAVLFVAAGFALTATIAGWLQGEFDRGLEAKARALAALTEQWAGQIELEVEGEHLPEFGASAGAEYFELRHADGSLISRSPSFELDDETRRARLSREPGLRATAAFRDVRLPDGRRGRQVQVDFVPAVDPEDDPGGPGALGAGPAPAHILTATLIVARERERLDGDVRRLERWVAGVGVGLMLALAGLTQLGLRLGLRSLDRLTRQVRALDVTSLGTRVAVEAPPAEIAVVVEQVNALLDRLEAGFRRERRLSSDIAHELKTPIAELRNLTEIGGRWPGDRAAARRFFEDARLIALQMERVVVHLVALARYDEGGEPVRLAPVLIAELVEAAWKSVAREATARRVECRQEISPALRFQTDPDKLALIVGNLLSNAVTYSPPGSAVVCTSAEGNGRASVTFSNRSENLEPPDLAVMFDRFWRKDEARTGGHHVGLGLALVRAMADLLAIRIDTRLDPDRTFRITLSVPAAPERPEPPPRRLDRPRPISQPVGG
jgi:signal transduction histidine kinase